jgi:hypothetical protein
MQAALWLVTVVVENEMANVNGGGQLGKLVTSAMQFPTAGQVTTQFCADAG